MNPSLSGDARKSIQDHNLAPLLGGLAGGGTSTIILHPLDLIKVRMQANEERYSFFKNVTSIQDGNQTSNKSLNQTQKQKSIELNSNQSNIKMKGTVRSQFRSVIQKEGVLGLYQGLSPALIGSAISWGGYFYIYESIKRSLLIQKQKKYMALNSNIKDYGEIKLQALDNFFAACSSGAVLVLLTNPIWLIKTRMQLQTRQLNPSQYHHTTTSMEAKPIHNNGNVPISKTPNLQTTPSKSKVTPYKGILDAAQTIIKEEGPMALYKGALPALMLVSHGGVQFVSYEFLKSRFGKYNRAKRRQNQHIQSQQPGKKDNHLPSLTIFEQLHNSMGYLTMGAVSKMIASLTTYPLQVIKTRLQRRSNNTFQSQSKTHNKISKQGAYAQSQPYFGVIDCTRRIWVNEGTYGFFKGCLPNAVRVAPSAAITFVVYESVMDFLTFDDDSNT